MIYFDIAFDISFWAERTFEFEYHLYLWYLWQNDI